MKNQTTTVTHVDATYKLNIGAWHNHLYNAASEAVYEVVADEIFLPNRQKAGVYKAEKRAEYDAHAEKTHSSAKKYLSSCSQRDFELEWDTLISKRKSIINHSCVPLLLPNHQLTREEYDELLNAANNGHVAAMFRVGAELRFSKDDTCLMWLSRAHNHGHVGAAYEMAAHLAATGNHLESLRCLIVAADGGFDIAFLTLFDVEILAAMCQVQQPDLLEDMLNELAATPFSSARYFKGMLIFLQGKKAQGLAILESYAKNIKKPLAKDVVDETHHKQIEVVSRFLFDCLADIRSGKQPLLAVSTHSKDAGFLRFQDYDEVLNLVTSTLASRAC